MSRSRRSLAVALLATLIVHSGFARRAVAGEDAPATYDCGTLALYSLLRIEGRTVGMRELESRLPPMPPSGYSMRQLRDAAGALGLPLEGVLLKDRAKAPDRPVLAFIRDGGHGHYFVVRPIGYSGQLVQAIDPARGVEALDASDLYNSPGWTGLVLRPVRPNWPARVAGMFTVLTLIVLVYRWRWGRSRVPIRASGHGEGLQVAG